MEVLKYDKTGKESGKQQLNPAVFDVEVNYEAVKEYLLLQLSNKRRSNASTKTRSEVAGGGRKPWKQKGTGRARAGSTSSPVWVGGGVAHGPTGKNHTKKMPKKVRRLALRSILTDKARGGGLVVIEDISLESKRTKDAVAIINNLGAEKVLFIEPERVEGLELSTRNIPGVKTLIYKNINPHDLINHSKVVVLESALAKIEEVVL
ncbi:MAG: 50S ribosomal protein L4 [bacterium]|nr:50S ribosomal protein L4 [bacterium]